MDDKFMQKMLKADHQSIQSMLYAHHVVSETDDFMAGFYAEIEDFVKDGNEETIALIKAAMMSQLTIFHSVITKYEDENSGPEGVSITAIGKAFMLAALPTMIAQMNLSQGMSRDQYKEFLHEKHKHKVEGKIKEILGAKKDGGEAIDSLIKTLESLFKEEKIPRVEDIGKEEEPKKTKQMEEDEAIKVISKLAQKKRKTKEDKAILELLKKQLGE